MSGAQRGFNFGRPIASGSGAQRGFNFGGGSSQTITLSGEEFSAYGLPSVVGNDSFVVSDATLGEQGGYGTALLYRTLPATGWVSAVVAPPTVINVAQGAFPGGIAPPPQTGAQQNRQIPTPWVSFLTRTLGLSSPSRGIAPPTFPTSHVIAFDTQFIDLAGRGPNPWVTGTLRIEFSQRTVSPLSIQSNIFGAHNVARIQVAAPSGWESSFLSENHELDINLQRVFVATGAADQAAYGATSIRNQFEVLAPASWASTTVAFPIAYNVDQYVAVAPYMGTNSDPTLWPPFAPFVENENRRLGASGWQSSRFSIIGNVIENTAAPLLPDGLDATLWGPETFIAYRIREVAPTGWDSFYNTQYSVVYNAAAVLAPSGWSSSWFGVPGQVANLNRTVRHAFPYAGSVVGTHFVADAVRAIAPGLFYDVPSGFPEVRRNPHPFVPAGIASSRFGGPDVVERFTIVAPKSVNVPAVPRIGEPIIANRNRTLLVFPSEQTFFGIAVVANYDSYLGGLGSDTSVWGSHLIARRTRTLFLGPTSTPTFPNTHTIRNDIPDPPARQLVTPASVILGANPNNPGIVPTHTIRLMTAFPEGWVEARYGAHEVRSNTITLPPWPFSLEQMGNPTLVATQFVFPTPWPQPSSDQNWVWNQRPRVSPHTIYAPSSDMATAQARLNHTPRNPTRVDEALSISDGRWSRDGGWPFFGRPDISNQFRSIGPVPTHTSTSTPSSRFGDGTLALRRRFVFPNPIISLRMGVVAFLGVPQYVDFAAFNDGIPPLNSFGEATVAPPPPPPGANPAGYIATMWGEARVELFNRWITPQGIPHRGNPQQNLTNPWGVPLVGFPRVYSWGGYELTLWGNTWVSYRDRAVSAQGWDSSTLGRDDLGSFNERMRVFRRNPAGSTPGIAPATVYGNLLISFGIRTVFGRGVLGYNSGDHLVKAVAALLPTGWDSLEVGDIDRWEADKIKAHGDDLSLLGTPRMLHPLRPSGPLGDGVGSPRVGVPVRPMGLPEIGFAGPSVSNPFGCTNRVVTPLPILSQQNVPQPVLT